MWAAQRARLGSDIATVAMGLGSLGLVGGVFLHRWRESVGLTSLGGSPFALFVFSGLLGLVALVSGIVYRIPALRFLALLAGTILVPATWQVPSFRQRFRSCKPEMNRLVEEVRSGPVRFPAHVGPFTFRSVEKLESGLSFRFAGEYANRLLWDPSRHGFGHSGRQAMPLGDDWYLVWTYD